MNKLKLITAALILLCFPFLLGDEILAEEIPQFKSVTARFPNSDIKTIYRGSDGFLWIGTGTGLVRYDGFEAVSYTFPEGGISSLQRYSPNEYVDRIVEYPEGQLWVRSGSFYSVFDTKKEQYVRQLDSYLADMGINAIPIYIFADSKQRLWMGFFGGFLKCLDVSGKVEDIQLSTQSAERDVSAMGETSEGIVIVYNDATMVCIDNNSFKELWSVKSVGENGKSITHEDVSIFVDSGGLIWLYCHDWQKCYDPKQQRWVMAENFSSHNQENGVFSICQDTKGRIWIGREHCLEILDKRTGEKLSLVHKEGDERSIPYNTVSSLYCDRDGIVWVGTRKNGMAYYHEGIYKSGFYPMGDVNVISSFKGGNIWLGTNDEGLVRWNTETGEQQKFGDSGTLQSKTIVSLLPASDGRLWIGTFTGGLSSYDGQTFRHYAEADGLANPNVWALAEDPNKNIWIGTLGGGVQMLNPQTNTFTTFNSKNTSLPIDIIPSLYCGKSGCLYIASMSSGIYVKYPTGDIKPLGKASEMTQFIYQILEDSHGLLWLATHSGLMVYDKEMDSIKRVPISGSTPMPVIIGLAEDSSGHIWASTVNEVLSIDRNGHVRVFNEDDGLKIGSASQKSIHVTGDNRVLLGTLLGVNIIDPDIMVPDGKKPNVLFSRLDVLGRKVQVGDTIENRQVLSQSLNSCTELTLSHDQSSFTIYFASDNMIMPTKTRFRYRLEGIDREYYECAPDVHWATYTSIPSGYYTLHVVAIGSNGEEGEERLLHIRILPPWWLSVWAWIVYVMLALGLMVLAYRFVRNRELHKFQIQQLEDDARKTEEMNQMKFRFFTNVSHELRTPLTLILSPLENVIHNLDDGLQKSQLTVVQKNANRLLMLVNQLLDFRKIEMADMKVHLSQGNIVEFIKGICDSFRDFTEKQGIQLTFFSAVPSIEMAFDEDKVSKIMFNLLSNAFKFTPDNGRVDVSITPSREQADSVTIRVADTGIGIKDADKQRIFDRFYQVDDTADTRHAAGSGIGLSLVKDFVEMHGGTISVVDNIESGSVFIIHLPIRKIDSDKVEKNEAQLLAPVSTEDTASLSGDHHIEQNEERQSVLIVDDNEEMVSFMRDIFSLYYNVYTAANGQLAWDFIQSTPPDIIVSDMMMPVMDGNELCRLVKSDIRTRKIPFIMLTARHAEESRVESLKLGADDYVTKPFNTEVLLLRMRKLLELASQQRHGLIDPEVEEIEITPLDEQLVADAIKYVEQNMSSETLSVEELSQALAMSRTNLYKKLLAITGKTPIEFIRIIRLKRAAQLLRSGSGLSISEIAYRVGLNPRIFSRHFKEEFGCLPSEYKESS